MTEAQTMVELAGHLEFYKTAYRTEWETATPCLSWDEFDLVLTALRDASTASAAAAQPVAWTNKAQLGFLDDPACADIPMAMWSKTSPASPIPLYAALAKPPKDGSTVTCPECQTP